MIFNLINRGLIPVILIACVVLVAFHGLQSAEAEAVNFGEKKVSNLLNPTTNQIKNGILTK